ncbi:MAG TPA: hypothetical protein VNK95_17905 [Caldilineaceae bacterium]|nr:hypothetical protein [Caldilineaceae bacterium]
MNTTIPQWVQQIGWEWNTIRQRFGPLVEEEAEPLQDAGPVLPAETRSRRSSTPTTGEAYLARLTGEWW